MARKLSRFTSLLQKLRLFFATLKGAGAEETESGRRVFQKFKVKATYGIVEYGLAFCYEFGGVLSKYDTEAAKAFREAAEQGNAEAQNNLGVCYEVGNGVFRNEMEAVKCKCRFSPLTLFPGF